MKKKYKIFLISILVAAVVFVLYIRWSGRMEAYCYKKALEVIGEENNWSKKIFPTEPEEYTYLGKDGKITQGFREELKCERDPDVQRKFQGWF